MNRFVFKRSFAQINSLIIYILSGHIHSKLLSVGTVKQDRNQWMNKICACRPKYCKQLKIIAHDWGNRGPTAAM